MFKLYCDVCGKEVTPEEGTLSWRDDGSTLSDLNYFTSKTRIILKSGMSLTFTSGCFLVLQVTQNSSNCSLIIGIKDIPLKTTKD